jgi:hypothetical protein
LVAYVTGGDPDFEASADILRALERGGADVIEIGVPFSDPIADGPVIQRATERALAAGATLARTLDLVAHVRASVTAPIVLFTYVNPVFRMGTDQFVARAAEAGVDGVLLLDLPIEESAPMRAALDQQGLDQIFLVSPTTSDRRLAEAASLGRGHFAIGRDRRARYGGGLRRAAGPSSQGRDESADCDGFRDQPAGTRQGSRHAGGRGGGGQRHCASHRGRARRGPRAGSPS